MRHSHTVVVILEALPGKQNELKQALLNVVAPSRAEKTCLEYRLHQNMQNPNEFVLYENWTSASEHKKQFDKPYIKSLAQQIEPWLAKPYQYIIADELN